MKTILSRVSLLLLLVVFCSSLITAQDVTGVWKSIDDETGKDKSYVEIYIKNNKLYGKITKVLDSSKGENPLCTACKGSKKNKPIVGMEIIRGLEKDGSEWYLDEGILDPENGKVYDCKIWLEDKNTLNVRGYIGFFYRTQEWKRVK